MPRDDMLTAAVIAGALSTAVLLAYGITWLESRSILAEQRARR